MAKAKSRGLSDASLMQVLYQAGFRGDSLVTAFAVAKAESGGRPGAYNGNTGTGDQSYGLFQINMLGDLGPARRRQYGLKSNNDLNDPLTNAKIAFAMSSGGKTWTPWSVHPDSKARGGKGSGFEAHLGSAQRTYTTLRANNTLKEMPAVSGAVTGNYGGGVTPNNAGGSYSPDDLAESFGFSAAFFETDKSLKALLDRAIEERWYESDMGVERFKASLRGTAWYQKHTAAERSWTQLQTSDPREAKRQIELKKDELKATALQLGVRIPDGRLDEMARKSLRFGLSDQEVTIALGSEMKFSKKWDADGTAGALQDQFRQAAWEYGVNIKDEDQFKWVKNVLTGKQNSDHYLDFLKTQVKAKFPGMTKQLDSGMTVRQIASPYLSAQAELLELDPNTIDLTKDKTLGQAFSWRGDQAADAPSLMPIWQYEEQLRKDPRWMQTKNARSSFMETGTNLLRTMGLVV